jgi:hypothetical protein
VGGDFSKAIRQAINVTPEKLAGVGGIDAMTTLEASVTNADTLTLTTAGFTIFLGKTTHYKLLHDVEEVVSDEVTVGILNEGRADIRVGLRKIRHSILNFLQMIDRIVVSFIVARTTFRGDVFASAPTL